MTHRNVVKDVNAVRVHLPAEREALALTRSARSTPDPARPKGRSPPSVGASIAIKMTLRLLAPRMGKPSEREQVDGIGPYSPR